MKTKSKIKLLRLESIRTDGGTQMRDKLIPEVVADYQEKIENGVDLGGLKVVFDGEAYWLWDGFHRLEAYRLNGAAEAPCEIEEGTKREAVLRATGANQEHGLRRDWPAKRRAVLTLLQDEEWAKLSNPEVAKQVGVSKEFVRLEREKLEAFGKPYGLKPEIFQGAQPVSGVATVATPMSTAELRRDSTGRMQPAHKGKKKKLEEPDLEYLSETTSQDMSLEALQMAWADFRVVNDFTDEEFKAALENPTSFHEYLNQIRKQYNRADVAEAARKILNRLYPESKTASESEYRDYETWETQAIQQKKDFEGEFRKWIEEWLARNSLDFSDLALQPDEHEERYWLDTRLRLAIDLGRDWPLVDTEVIALLLSSAIYTDLPRWIEEQEELKSA